MERAFARRRARIGADPMIAADVSQADTERPPPDNSEAAMVRRGQLVEALGMLLDEIPLGEFAFALRVAADDRGELELLRAELAR